MSPTFPALFLTLALLSLAVPASAETTCVGTFEANACYEDSTTHSEGCESYEGGSYCATTDSHTRRVTADTLFSSSEIEREETTWQAEGDAELGDCTTLSQEGTETFETTETSTYLFGPVASGAVYAGVYQSEAEGTLVYEDPCGEDLANGEIAPGTYDYEAAFSYVRGGVMLYDLVTGFHAVQADVFRQTVDAENRDDPEESVCQDDLTATVWTYGEDGWESQGERVPLPTC